MPLADPMQRQLMLVALELELRRRNGTGFQDFFAQVMGKRHPGDYVPVRPFGRRGDKGCDGYLRSSGEVFAAYGAVNSEGSKVQTLVTKMGDDFSKAKKDLESVMKRWTMVHNFVDGLPVEAIQELDRIERENPQIKCCFFGKKVRGDLSCLERNSCLLSTRSCCRNTPCQQFADG